MEDFCDLLPSKHLIDACASEHQCKYFCIKCNSAYCAECWIRCHRGELRTHDELALNAAIALNADGIDKSLHKLKELSGIVEALYEAETREMRETEGELAVFCAEVKRRLISETRERRIQHLQNIRDAIATSLEEESASLPEESVAALSAQRVFLETLECTNRRVRQTLEKSAVKLNLCETVEEILFNRFSYKGYANPKSESRNATNESAVKSDEIMKKRDQIGMELDLFKSEYERTLSRQKESYEQQLQQLELSLLRALPKQKKAQHECCFEDITCEKVAVSQKPGVESDGRETGRQHSKIEKKFETKCANLLQEILSNVQRDNDEAQQLADAQKQLAALQGEKIAVNEKLKSAIEKWQDAAEQLKSVRKDAAIQMEKDTQMINQLTDQINDLKEEWEESEAKQVGTLNNKIAFLEDDCENAHKMISQLTLELQKATRTRDQLGTKLGLTKSMLSESQKRREHLEAEVAEKEKTLCQKERELQELQVQLDIILYTTDK